MEFEDNIIDLGTKLIPRLPYDQSVLNSISYLIEDEPSLQSRGNEKLGIARNIIVSDLFNCVSYGAIGLASWRIGKSAAEQIIHINKNAIINILMKDNVSVKPSLLKLTPRPILGVRMGVAGVTSIWLGMLKFYFDNKKCNIKHKMRLEVLDKFDKIIKDNSSTIVDDYSETFRKRFLECKGHEDCIKVFNDFLKSLNQLDKNELLKVKTDDGYVYIDKSLIIDSNIKKSISRIEDELDVKDVINESQSELSDSSFLSVDSPFEDIIYNISDPYLGIMVMVILTLLLTIYLYTMVIINLLNPDFLKVNSDRFQNKYIILWLKHIEKSKEYSLKLLIILVYLCLLSAICFMLMLIDLYPPPRS